MPSAQTPDAKVTQSKHEKKKNSPIERPIERETAGTQVAPELALTQIRYKPKKNILKVRE